MDQQITYLVTAATGFTGRATIAALQANGQQYIRAFVHREDERSQQLRAQGVEIVFGDMLDFESVRTALQGVQRAYFCFPIAPGMLQATAQFAQAAKEAGVNAIVNMSQKIAREDAQSHDAFDHWLAERVFDWSGVPVTHIRPTFFAEWLLYLSPMIQQGTIYAPYGPGKAAFIASEDQGRVIAHILQSPQPYQGQIYPLYGPVEYTFSELAGIVGRVLGRDIAYQQVPFEVLRQAFTTGTANVARNDSLTGYAESNRPDDSGEESHASQHLREAAIDMDNGLFSGTDNIIERITGQAPMMIEDFVLKHRAALSPIHV